MSEEKRLLVVDDEEHLRQMLSAALGFHGFEVTDVDNGRDALRLHDELRPDLIVLDVMMPGLDGWTLYARLRDIPGLDSLPVLFVTCLSDFASEPEMRDAKLCATMSKPILAEQLYGEMAQLLVR